MNVAMPVEDMSCVRDIVLAHVVMAHVVMAHVVMAHIVMAPRRHTGRHAFGI